MLSRPVLVGYLTGIALIMIAGQLENVTGVPVEGGAFLADIASFAGHIELVHGPTLGMSTTVLAFLIVVGTLLPRIPGPLVPCCWPQRRARCSHWTGSACAWSDRSPRDCRCPQCGHHARRPRAPAPGGAGGRRRRLLRQRTDSACVRRQAAPPPRFRSGVARPRGGEPRDRVPAGIPGQQQCWPHHGRPCRRWPQPAHLRGGSARGARRAHRGRTGARRAADRRTGRSGGVRGPAAGGRRRAAPHRPVPAFRAVHRPRHDDRGAPRRSALRRVDRGRAVDPRPAAAGLPPARRGAGLRSGPRRPARHRRLPSPTRRTSGIGHSPPSTSSPQPAGCC
jgi:hypothetical protein